MDRSELTDDFLLTLSHDLGAFVRKSIAGLQLIERSMGGALEISLRQRFEQVVSANKQLEQFLGRLSDYANAGHPSGGRPLPLPVVLQAAISQFPAKDISIKQPVPDSLEEARFPIEIVKVFSELIDNALKFSRNAPVSIEIAISENGFQVDIADSGIGLAATEEDQVFQLLNKLHSRDEYPGFGMGLPICRRLANSIGARVRLTAKAPGPGAVATVDLPHFC